eukprot:360794-Chlamydomonas_euryale.AAC.15
MAVAPSPWLLRDASAVHTTQCCSTRPTSSAERNRYPRPFVHCLVGPCSGVEMSRHVTLSPSHGNAQPQRPGSLFTHQQC